MPEWRPIPDWPGYFVSRCGRVRGPGRDGLGAELRPTTAHPVGHPKHVYFKVGLTRGRKLRRWFYVHRLVCSIFNGPAPPGFTDCCHLDDNPANNHASNLLWASHRDNCRQTYSEDVAERHAVRDEVEGLLDHADRGPNTEAPF